MHIHNSSIITLPQDTSVILKTESYTNNNETTKSSPHDYRANIWVSDTRIWNHQDGVHVEARHGLQGVEKYRDESLKKKLMFQTMHLVE